MDRMRIKGYQFYGYHGVFPEENKLGQWFIVDLELTLDMRPSAQTDDLSLTVDYVDVHETVRRIVEGPPFKLIETLAHKIASEILSTYTIVDEVTVAVTKARPPVRFHFGGATVEIRRRRGPDGGIVPVA